MGITEILRRIWLFSANKIKSSESFSNNQLNSLSNSTHHCGTYLSHKCLLLCYCTNWKEKRQLGIFYFSIATTPELSIYFQSPADPTKMIYIKMKDFKDFILVFKPRLIYVYMYVRSTSWIFQSLFRWSNGFSCHF